MESFGFPYGEDALTFYKLYRRGGRLGILYNSGITNLDAQSSSGVFRKGAEYFYVRTKAMFIVWWRTCLKNGKDTAWTRFLAATAFSFKAIWLVPVMTTVAIVKRDVRVLSSYFSGLRDGWKDVHFPGFKALPPYIA